MTETKDRAMEGKEERQKTMDKLSIDTGEAETFDRQEGEGTGCLHNVQPAKEERQKKMDEGTV